MVSFEIFRNNKIQTTIKFILSLCYFNHYSHKGFHQFSITAEY